MEAEGPIDIMLAHAWQAAVLTKDYHLEACTARCVIVFTNKRQTVTLGTIGEERLELAMDGRCLLLSSWQSKHVFATLGGFHEVQAELAAGIEVHILCRRDLPDRQGSTVRATKGCALLLAV